MSPVPPASPPADRAADALARAHAHRAKGEAAEALAALDEALALSPAHGGAWTAKGQLLAGAGRLEEALAAFWRALACPDGTPPPWAGIADALIRANRLAEAWAAAASALAATPLAPEAWRAAAALLCARSCFAAAQACLERALALAPDHADTVLSLAGLMVRKNRFTEAQSLYARAAELAPLSAAAHSGYAQTLISRDRLDEAERHLRRALELDPDHLDAHLGLARLLLLKGDLANGWIEYEWRRRKKESRLPRFPGREWDGGPLEGRRLLVYAEQGFGDIIQFCRYIPILAGKGAAITFLVPPEMERLLAVQGFPAIVTAKVPAEAGHDLHIPLLSVPRLLGISLDAVPARTPYLKAPAAGIRLPVPLGTRLKVGLVFAGNPRHANDQNRSLGLDDLVGLAGIEGVTLYSLQTGPRAGEIARRAHPVLIRDASPLLKDFAATAAIVAQLDLVVAVDTAIAHLAGALGKPVWLLRPMAPDWRWLPERADTPWYPTMRLFRQAPEQPWDEVVAALHAELARVAAARPPLAGPAMLEVASVFTHEGRPRFRMAVPGTLLGDAGLGYLVRHERSGQGYEYATRAFIDAHLPEDGLFIDVGAHWGIMSLQAATRHPGRVRVLAVEASPLNAAHLRRHIAQNGLDGVVETVEAAIADAPGQGSLTAQSTMGHSLVKSGQGPVAVTTLDRLMAERPALGTGPVMVKIDVEGGEADVVAGMAGLLESGRVAAVIWEIGPAHQGAAGAGVVAAIRARFAALGFSAFRFASEAGAGALSPYADGDTALGNVFELAAGLSPFPLYGLPRRPPPVQPPDPAAEVRKRAARLFQEGAAHQGAGRMEQSLASFAAIADLDLGNPQLFNSLGVALRGQGKLAAAEAAYRRSLALAPKSAGILSNLGNVLRERGKLGEAEQAHRDALALGPDEPRLHYNLGLLLRDAGRPLDSRQAFEATLAREPGNGDCRWDLALALLQAGDYGAGFKAYEARWNLERAKRRAIPLPHWAGEPLEGRSLFLHDEQGFGDVLQWARFIPELRRRGAGRVVLECQPELMRLLAMADGVDAVVRRGAAVPACDLYAPLLSLPGIFGTTLSTLPAAVPYLKAPPPSFRLTGDERLKLGLVWAGKPTPRDRSCPLERLLEALGDPAFSLHGLQLGPHGDDLARSGASLLVEDLGPRLGDFADTAAVLAQLDLLVTIDTSVAHLAGALGVPTFLLLLHTSDWRWFDQGTTSPWYPSFRLFRQSVPFRWDEPLAELKAALGAFAAAKHRLSHPVANR